MLSLLSSINVDFNFSDLAFSLQNPSECISDQNVKIIWTSNLNQRTRNHDFIRLYKLEIKEEAHPNSNWPEQLELSFESTAKSYNHKTPIMEQKVSVLQAINVSKNFYPFSKFTCSQIPDGGWGEMEFYIPGECVGYHVLIYVSHITKVEVHAHSFIMVRSRDESTQGKISKDKS